MKKRFFLLISLGFCLLLSACGGKDSISGEVVEATPSALILEMSDGKRVAVLLEENTHIFGMNDIDGDNYKAAPHTGVRVSFFHEGRASSIPAADGTQVKAYHADSFIRIDAYLIPEAAILSDGTVLDAWKTGTFGTTYQTKDGVELLREDCPNGPENHYVANMESFDDLSETAKSKVTAFYEKQGKLYDLQAELERAWTAYQADSEAFTSFVVRQDSSPAASSEQIFYFRTDLTRTVSGNIVQETTLCAAFDRNTGVNVPLADLFSCPQENIGRNLLSLAEKEGTGPTDPGVKSEMEAAFLVSVTFNEDCKVFLYPWAVPDHITA